MIYAVLWSDDAAVRLIATAAAGDEAAVIRVADRLDAALGYCPARVGESRGSGERIGIERPLVVSDTIDEAARQVHIFRVWTPTR